MSGFTHGAGVLGGAVIGEQIVASAPAGGAAGTVVRAAHAALPYTGIALGIYLVAAVLLFLVGFLLSWVARRKDA